MNISLLTNCPKNVSKEDLINYKEMFKNCCIEHCIQSFCNHCFMNYNNFKLFYSLISSGPSMMIKDKIILGENSVQIYYNKIFDLT